MRTAVAILALSVVCHAASRKQRTEWFREAIREQLQQVEKQMAAPNAEPTTRDLPNAALATLMLGGDARRAEQYILTMYSHQDMDTASPGYGTIPWQVGHPEIRDANSIEFCTQPMGPMLKGYGKLLSAGFIDKIKPNLRAAFTAIRRHKVAVTYTNIFLMKTVNLILAGEATGDAAAAADGYELLDQWIEHTREAGIGEFDSPNYYAVNLNSLLMGYRHAARPAAKEKFRALLDFFWSDIAANFFEPRGSLSGPHSRGYDFLGGHESVELFLYQEGLRRTPPASKPSIGRIYLLENEKPGGYRPGADILALGRLPRRIVQSRWRAEPGRERYNFITPHFAIGSTSGHYGTHDKLINIELAAREELPAIYIGPDITDAPYGRQRFKDRSGHGKPVHVPLNAVSVQSEGRMLVLLDLNPSTLAETGTFATNVVIPANADRIAVDGERYSAKAPFTAPARIGSVALVRAGRAAVAIRFFAADGAAGYQPEVTLQADADGLSYGAARFSVYHYRGAARKLSEEHVRAGLLIEAAQCDTEASVKELLARVSSAKIDHSSDRSVWSARASVGGLVLEAARDMAKGRPAHRRIDGKDAPAYVLNVNGKELAESLPSR